MVDDTSKGFLVPSKANRTLAQALDCFQGDIIDLLLMTYYDLLFVNFWDTTAL